MKNEKFSPQLLKQIKQSCNLPEIVGQYIHLNRNLRGLCPFHPEKTPSFYIYPEKQRWRCFGCGKSGDIFAFIALIEGVNFPEAVKLVAVKTNVPLPRSERFKEYISRKWKSKQRLLKNLETAGWYFKQAEFEKRGQLLLKRKKLPTKSRWNSWNSLDYLSEQIVDYEFDLLDARMKKIYKNIEEKRKEVLNG